MEYHSTSCIGAGDVRIPILSISTWKTNDEDLENALNTALGLGYRGIRTWFGECKAIGPILREMFQSNKIRREDIFISASLPPIGNRYEDVEHFLKFSLDLLQLDYLDLFTIGSPMAFIREGDLMIPVNENGEVLLDLKSDFLKTWKGMEEQVTAGRTKSIGLAYFNLSQVQRILDYCTIKPANLITELHVYCQQKELVSFCKKNGIVLTAEFPFGSPGLQQFVDSLDGDKKFIPSPLKDPVILDLAKKHKKRPSQIILRYLTECGMATLIKAMNPKRIRECFDNTDEDLRNALNTALGLGDIGIRTWFGECRAIGSILREMFESNKIRREDLFISAMLPPVGNRYEDVEHFMRMSLDSLQLDYVDLYEIGSPMGFIREGDSILTPVDENGDILLDLKTDFVKTWKGMEEQVTAGRARSIGLAHFNQSQVQRILNHCTIKPSNLTTELHLYCQQKELISFCKRNGITVTAEHPFGSPGLKQVLVGLDGEKKFVPSLLKDPIIADIAKKHKKRPSQIILRYLIECGVATLIKAMNPNRIQECFDIFDFQLTGEDLDRINELDQGEDGRTIGGSASTGVLR